MRISFYSESPDPGPGGAEQFIAVLAEELSRSHEVCIVHHKSAEAESRWGDYAGCDLSQVKFRHVAREIDDSHFFRNPWQRYRAARAWRREITENCDVFVGLLHSKAPFCRAPKGVIVCLFPTYQPFLELAHQPASKPTKKNKKKKTLRAGWFANPAIHRAYAKWEWRRRMKSYPVKLAISEFSWEWARRRWRIETGILHPPVAIVPTPTTAKEKRILSIGRFATTGHTKKQIELLETFQQLQTELPDWSYSTVGGLNETEQDQRYFERARAFREVGRIEVTANIERSRIDSLCARAKIFWHAAGLGDDHAALPEMAEHFGLSTVEAMAQGCVPIAINKGGQSEIVEQGVSGFLWDTLEELKDYTRRLTRDSALLEKMAAAARRRAEDFSRERCVERLASLIGLTND